MMTEEGTVLEEGCGEDVSYPAHLIEEGLAYLRAGAPDESGPTDLRSSRDRGLMREQLARFRVSSRLRQGIRCRTVPSGTSASRGRREIRTAPAARTSPTTDAGPPADDGPDVRQRSEVRVVLPREKYEAVTDALADLIIACLERRFATPGGGQQDGESHG